MFLEAVALFGTPAIIGIPARINVATTQLWQFFEFPVRVDVAAAYAMPLLLITLAMVGVQRMMFAAEAMSSQTGKGGERRPIQLRPWRWPLLGWCLLVGLSRRRVADAGAAGGIVRQSLGTRTVARQPHAAQLPLSDLPA